MEGYSCRWKQACNFGDRGHHPGALPGLFLFESSPEMMQLDHCHRIAVSHSRCDL